VAVAAGIFSTSPAKDSSSESTQLSRCWLTCILRSWVFQKFAVIQTLTKTMSCWPCEFLVPISALSRPRG
jgi:hypothetical protein